MARQQSRRASITGGRRRSTSGRRSSTSGISLSSLVSRRASLASRRSSLASRRSSVASSASRRGSAVSLGAIASAAANAKRRGRRASLSSAAAYTDASVAMGVAGGKKDAGDFLDARLATTHMDDSLAKQQLNPDIIHEFAHRVAAKLNRQPQLDSDSDSNSDGDSTTSSSDSGDDTDSSASVSGGEEQATPASMRGRSARRGGFISPNNFVLPKEVLSVGFKKRSLYVSACPLPSQHKCVRVHPHSPGSELRSPCESRPLALASHPRTPPGPHQRRLHSGRRCWSVLEAP